MLTESEKEKISAEEYFRHEIKESLEKSKKEKIDLWKILNSSFFISVVVGSFISFSTWLYEKNVEKSNNRIRTFEHKIDNMQRILDEFSSSITKNYDLSSEIALISLWLQNISTKDLNETQLETIYYFDKSNYFEIEKRYEYLKDQRTALNTYDVLTIRAKSIFNNEELNTEIDRLLKLMDSIQNPYIGKGTYNVAKVKLVKQFSEISHLYEKILGIMADSINSEMSTLNQKE